LNNSAGTAFLFATAGQLVSIEQVCSLYLINPGDGTWRQSGPGGGWANTITGAVLGDTLYTVESSGTRYASDPDGSLVATDTASETRVPVGLTASAFCSCPVAKNSLV